MQYHEDDIEDSDDALMSAYSHASSHTQRNRNIQPPSFGFSQSMAFGSVDLVQVLLTLNGPDPQIHRSTKAVARRIYAAAETHTV